MKKENFHLNTILYKTVTKITQTSKITRIYFPSSVFLNPERRFSTWARFSSWE